MAVHKTDLDLTTRDVAGLISADALAAFLSRLGYDTGRRTVLTPTALGLSGDSASAVRSAELLSENGFLRVLFVQPKSLTARTRNDLIRILGKANEDYLLVLAATFDTLEFVFLDKETKKKSGPAGGYKVQVVPKIFGVDRRKPTPQDVRILRQFTWTHQDDLDQLDKLRVVFDNAIFTGEFFQNRGLFSDYFLRERLRDDPVWRENPSSVFQQIRNLYQDAQNRWHGKGRAEITSQLLKPVFGHLGFLPLPQAASAGGDGSEPDFFLKDPTGARNLSAAFVYPWGRWLDGPDFQDPDHPDENPGARVVAAIEEGHADWAIVTNGRLWRLYSRQAHARSTNLYEIDLIEALNVSGETDPNEAFRYWWLFFRSAAFRKDTTSEGCWLDGTLQGSRDYAKRLGDRLKERIFLTIFPHLAEGFLADRRARLGLKGKPTPEELSDVYEATLTLLYRLLFLLYAESRDLLPVREGPYGEASLKKIKEEIAARAGVALDDANALLEKAYSDTDTVFYNRLCALFKAMDKGDPALNVPTYNGGLFNTVPDTTEDRDQRIARFLRDHRVPDRYLARAIDRLARDQDEKTLGLVFIDFKSLEVRHLGSIYEGLLEFKLKVADEDLTTQTEKNQEKYIPLSVAKAKRGRSVEVVVKKGEVYLSNDKAERKASGAYYTPDPIVEYIVGQTVGPILGEKLEALRPEFRKVRRTFENELQKAIAYPPQGLSPSKDKEAIRRFAIEKTYATHKDLVERLFDIKVLDPAMGSGHFLVEAVDRITDKLLQFLNAFPVNPVSSALERTRSSILESLTTQGVTVVRDKLTDINLLKRHVLKRCIYGVDLNPMAVELAKVSLWLDAFTLGAPLSFLDHHLRCGNSLVGATLADLEAATSGRLFRLDYGPLLAAIKYVLFVSQMTDATASEVADSMRQYQEARKLLSGYRIVLDLVLADHFGHPAAKGLVSSGNDLNFADRQSFLLSLHDDKEKKLVALVEKLARRPDRRFFHWDIEFPEAFIGFFDPNKSKIMHKERVKAGTAGFDAVVGNPPYDVLAETEKEQAADLEDVLRYFAQEPIYQPSHKGKQNLYKLFICRNICLLRSAGRVGLIVPMPLLGDEQAVGVRGLLLSETSVRAIEAFPQKDDARNRVFEDAKLSTCIFIAASAVYRRVADGLSGRRGASLMVFARAFRLVAACLHKPEAPAKLIVPPSAAPSRPVNFEEIWF